MIRFAQEKDFDAVRSLWDRCFPDDTGFTEWFFQRKYDPAVTLLDEEYGDICSMLQMLPYRLRDSRGIRTVTYIYGACTAPEYRRQHRMHRLLEYSFQLDKQQGRAASVLIPQEEWLYDFYSQFGYQTAFYIDTVLIQTKQGFPAAQRLSVNDIPAMCTLYEAGNSMRLLRTETDWRMQFELFDTLGIGVYGIRQGEKLDCYAFVWQDGAGKLWAQEACGADIPQLAQGILTCRRCTEIRMDTAGGQQQLGCIRYHDDTPVKTGYFNLLFN